MEGFTIAVIWISIIFILILHFIVARLEALNLELNCSLSAHIQPRGVVEGSGGRQGHV